jgi:hypothetical protein
LQKDRRRGERVSRANPLQDETIPRLQWSVTAWKLRLNPPQHLVLTGLGCTIGGEFRRDNVVNRVQLAKLTIDCCNTIIDPLG